MAANYANSITRIVVEYANQLVRQGIHVHISYPVFGFLDKIAWVFEKRSASFNRFFARPYRFLHYWRYLIVDTLRRPKPLSWQGMIVYSLDPRVQLRRFWFFPRASCLPNADVMVVMQNYFVPHLLFLPSKKGSIIGAVHMDYTYARSNDDENFLGWWEHFVRVEQRLNIHRFAVSGAVKTSAEALGIQVDMVINNGINLQEFHHQNREVVGHAPLRVLVYCALEVSKGQDMGCQVVRALKKIYAADRVQFFSIGRVQKEHQDVFDRNLEYLHGKSYVAAYQNADIFMYPSIRDGFPAPPLEALACGAVLVTTRVQGVAEYGVHGKNCLMAEPHDVEGMVCHVRQLIDDQALRERLRREGLKTVIGYSWERSAVKLVEFMNKVQRDSH